MTHTMVAVRVGLLLAMIAGMTAGASEADDDLLFAQDKGTLRLAQADQPRCAGRKQNTPE